MRFACCFAFNEFFSFCFVPQAYSNAVLQLQRSALGNLSVPIPVLLSLCLRLRKYKESLCGFRCFFQQEIRVVGGKTSPFILLFFPLFSPIEMDLFQEWVVTDLLPNQNGRKITAPSIQVTVQSQDLQNFMSLPPGLTNTCILDLGVAAALVKLDGSP